MPQTLVICAHPRPSASRNTDALRQVFATEPDTTVRSLYDLYPDFDIDVGAEQRALAEAEVIVCLAPVYWYSVPALMKHWFDQVLAYGWAYGPGGTALRGKSLWWVTSAGASQADYAVGGSHGRPFGDFVAPIETIAHFCGMRWLPPFVMHGGHTNSREQLSATAEALRQQWAQHLQNTPASGASA